MSNIYVLCPSYLVSGGPDALHQMVYYLNGSGRTAHIVYVDIKSRKYSIPEAYKPYVDGYKLLADIGDDATNSIVCPETLTFLLDNFKSVKKYIWWLSVGNNTDRAGFKNKLGLLFKKLSPRKFFKLIKKKNRFFNLKHFLKHKQYNFSAEDGAVTHLCASYYAYEYVSARTENRCELCIEPISKYFLDNSNADAASVRGDTVLYNPAKNLKFTKKIIKHLKGCEFLPLRGYSQSQLAGLYQGSKLYIDFGTFPGAERIPKEAVLNGCAIITGKNGASAYYNDVPIPDGYKFESTDENIEAIAAKIKYCIKNYGEIYHDFDIYRETVRNLESNFIQRLTEIFPPENFEG